MVIEDAFERFFYETECMKCNWSVRELRRQIKTNLFVRAGISKKPELLLTKSVDNANSNALTIKDPFAFEFLGLDAKEAVSESDLEQALMDHLQEFMLKLGQLNAYVGYYKKNEMMPGDNPPVGILLCTDKGSQMVEYALSGMDNQLFVSTYMLHLPDKRKLEEFMLKELEEMGM
ncbi:MAG: PDDEXK nuclease domain-containing protein [Clostridiales bacterium]|nr:PDDEXK nuclease domain-containing protein [Clostridiales bacterium]